LESLTGPVYNHSACGIKYQWTNGFATPIINVSWANSDMPLLREPTASVIWQKAEDNLSK
jgi:hypothetical protein